MPTQDFRILARNLSIYSTVVKANKQMIESNSSMAVIVLPEKNKNYLSIVGDSFLDISKEKVFEKINKKDKSVCLTIYRYNIPVTSSATTCYNKIKTLKSISQNEYEISEGKKVAAFNAKNIRDNLNSINANLKSIKRQNQNHIRLKSVVKNNTNRIKQNNIKIIEVDDKTKINKLKIIKVDNLAKKNKEKIGLNTKSALITFKLSATNSNILVAQNEFFQSVKTSSINLNQQVNRLDSKFKGFKNSVNSQLGALNINIKRLSVQIQNL